MPKKTVGGSPRVKAFMGSYRSPLKNALLYVERELYQVAIRASGGSVQKVARALGVSRVYAHNRLRRLGLDQALRNARDGSK